MCSHFSWVKNITMEWLNITLVTCLIFKMWIFNETVSKYVNIYTILLFHKHGMKLLVPAHTHQQLDILYILYDI